MKNKIIEKIMKKLLINYKHIKFALLKSNSKTFPVFIMGSGRSGTTMMINIFHRDLRVEALDENNKKIAKDYQLIPEKIPIAIKSSKAPVLVMKPILNSFNARYLLETYPTAKIIWMLRDYKDMVASSIKKFDNIVSGYLRNFIIHNTGTNWITKGLPLETSLLLKSLNTTEFDDTSWMALVWLVVNKTITIDDLHLSKRFLIVDYNQLVRNPEKILRTVYTFLNLEFNNGSIKFINESSIGRGRILNFHPQVENLCENLSSELQSLNIARI